MKLADTHRTSYTSYNTRTRRQTALTTPLDTAGRHLIYTRARRQTSHRHAWYRCRWHLIYTRARRRVIHSSPMPIRNRHGAHW